MSHASCIGNQTLQPLDVRAFSHCEWKRSCLYRPVRIQDAVDVLSPRAGDAVSKRCRRSSPALWVPAPLALGRWRSRRAQLPHGCCRRPGFFRSWYAKLHQVGDVDLAVIVAIALEPGGSAGRTIIAGQVAQVGDIDGLIKVGVAGEGVLHENRLQRMRDGSSRRWS